MSNSNLEEETLIIYGDSGMASPPVRPVSSTPATGNPMVDYQGIPWNLAPLTREEYRRQRREEFAHLEGSRPGATNYHGLGTSTLAASQVLQYFGGIPGSLKDSHTVTDKMRPAVLKDIRMEIPPLYRIQNHGDVYEWSTITGVETHHLKFKLFAGAQGRISTIYVTPNLILVGGYDGELLIKRNWTWDHSGADPTDPSGAYSPQSSDGSAGDPRVCLRNISEESEAITNHISPLKETPGSTERQTITKFLICSNDRHLRLYDAQADSFSQIFIGPFPINASAYNVINKLISISSDNKDIGIVDMRTGRQTMSLRGQEGYSFSCDWSPDGTILATANEDHTIRIWDMRRPDLASFMLTSKMCPVRSVRFSPDGLTLAMVEEMDYVSFFHVPSLFERSSNIDFFGDISGVDFTPDSEKFYVGCAEADRGGIIEMTKPKWRTFTDFCV